MNGKKKSILFACYGLGIGGIEKCMVNLINILPEAEFDVDVLVMNPEYALKPQIRRNVHFVDAFQYILNTEFTMQEIRKRGGLFRHMEKILPYIDHRIRIKLGLPLWTKFRPLVKNYDIAVAYSQNGLAPYYVIDKVQAKRKVLWYHNGAYEKPEKGFIIDQHYYNCFDYIVGVSDYCVNLLRDKFGFDEGKFVMLRNVCDVESILKNAEESRPDSFGDGYFHIVSVGRMAAEKGPDLALEACRQLREEGRNICWHWVGDGDQAAAIRRKAEQLGLREHFILEGNQTNPYPYINSADIYVQPSYYESYSMTTMEAKILCKPIVITNVGGMGALLKNGVNGLSVPVDAGAIAEAVGMLLDNESMRNEFTAALQKEAYFSEDMLAEYRRTVFA